MDKFQEKIASLFQKNFSEKIFAIDLLPGAGSSRRYYRITSELPHTMLACVGTDRDENMSFIYFSSVFKQANLPVPTVFATDETNEIYLISDLGKTDVLKAKEILEEANLKPEIIELCSIKPIDKELLIKSISKTKKVVTVEEHNIIGGLGSAVSEVIAEEGLGAKLLRLGTNDKFGKSGKSDEVIKMYGLDPESIASKIKTFV